MSEDEKLERLSDGFKQLSDESKDYILAISQALVFAKNTLTKPSPEQEETAKPVC